MSDVQNGTRWRWGDGDGSGMCGQCIMKERPLQKVEAGCGVPPLRRRQGVSGVPGAREPQEDIGKSTEGWHFTLRERQALARMIFPPRMNWAPRRASLVILDRALDGRFGGLAQTPAPRTLDLSML